MGRTVEIIVDIDKNGGFELEAKNFPDASCLKETQDIEEAIGKVEKRTKKAEASKKVEIGDKAIIGRG